MAWPSERLAGRRKTSRLAALRMAPVAPREVEPGMVVYIDPGILRTLGGCVTNASLDGEDRSVKGPHYFFIFDADNTTASAVVLFGEGRKGRDELDETLKSGHAAKWKGAPSFVHRWAQYWIPLESITLASVGDDSPVENRRRYSVTSPEFLTRIRAFARKNTNPKRPL